MGFFIINSKVKPNGVLHEGQGKAILKYTYKKG
jgi:hypothetical protein